MPTQKRKIIREKLSRLRKDRKGNIAITFALIATPLILAVGTGIDLARAYNVQSKMQSDLDSALIASVKQVDNLKKDDLKAKIKDWFAAQTSISAGGYTLDNIKISMSGKTITAQVSASVPTAFMQLGGIDKVDVSALSSVAGPSTSFLKVYIVLDKSASMLLPTTQADRSKLYELVYNYATSDYWGHHHTHTKCEFACHNFDGQYFRYHGQTYNNIYDFIKAYESRTGDNITLRTDTAVTAAEKVVDMIDAANSSTEHIKAGLYTLGDTIHTALSPTPAIPQLRNTLSADTSPDSSNLTSSSSLPISDFKTSMSELAKIVGTPGDGSSAAKPLKLVLLLTDGVQSQRSYVLDKVDWTWGYWYSNTVKTPKSGAYWNYEAPMNPDWCSSMKKAGITVGVLNTEYLAIPYDWGYIATLDRPMSSTQWNSIWGGTIRPSIPGSTKKRDYLKYALQDCASSASLFISASNQTDIENGLSTIFDNYLNSVRLTQ